MGLLALTVALRTLQCRMLHEPRSPGRGRHACCVVCACARRVGCCGVYSARCCSLASPTWRGSRERLRCLECGVWLHVVYCMLNLAPAPFDRSRLLANPSRSLGYRGRQPSLLSRKTPSTPSMHRSGLPEFDSSAVAEGSRDRAAPLWTELQALHAFVRHPLSRAHAAD